MLQFAGCVGLRVDVGDLLEFQRALHAQCVVQPASDVQQAVCGNQRGGDVLRLFLVLQNGSDAVRCLLEQFHQSAALRLIDFSHSQRQFKGKQIHHSDLHDVRLGGSHGDLRPCVGIDEHIRLPCDGTAHGVDNGEGLCPQRLRQTHCCQTVRRFTGLGDDDDKVALSHQRFPIAELRGNVHSHRHTCQLLDHVLAHSAGMHCRTARHHLNMAEATEHLRRNPALLQIGQAVLDAGRNGIANGGGLLVNLFQHEVGIAALADCLHIPVRRFQLFLHRLSKGIVDLHAVTVQHGDLLVFQQIVIPCVLDDCRHIRGNEALALANAHDQRAFTAHGIHLIRMVGEDDAQRIGALQVTDGLGNRLNGTAVIAVVQQPCHHFRVRVAGEGHALAHEEVFQLLVVFNDAVVHDGDSSAGVGMRIHIGRLAVSRPAGVADAHMPLWTALLFHPLLQIFQTALRLGNNDLPFLKHGDACGVISAVFQLAQTAHQNIRAIPLSHISNNSTHRINPSLSVSGKTAPKNRSLYFLSEYIIIVLSISSCILQKMPYRL